MDKPERSLNSTQGSVPIKEIDVYMNLYLEAFVQGVASASYDVFFDLKTYDTYWVFNKSDKRPLSFNWYCDLFNVDPWIIQKHILKNASSYQKEQYESTLSTSTSSNT